MSARPVPLMVSVERRQHNQVVVAWTWPDLATRAPITVELVTGSPDTPATRKIELSPAVTEVTFDAVAEHPRPWWRLSSGGGPHLLAAERRLPVRGTLNFRDLGGYPTANGGQTQWGRVFRSDNFADVPPEAWRQLHEMGLREVFDLRHDGERARQPTVIPDDLDIAMTVFAIGGEAAETPDVVEFLSGAGDRDFGINFMVEMYRELVAEHGTTFATLMHHLADPVRLPAVFHCTAGKDRTGVAAALLLLVLGVDREIVLDDYELSTRYRSGPRIEVLRPRLEAAGVDVESVRPFLSAPRAALAAALDHIEEHHGTAEGFLTSNGMDGGVPDQLRALLVVDS